MYGRTEGVELLRCSITRKDDAPVGWEGDDVAEDAVGKAADKVLDQALLLLLFLLLVTTPMAMAAAQGEGRSGR